MTEITPQNQSMAFHALNPEKGILNIGSHPENDIVVQDPRVSPFHMMLDLRQKPYHVIGLSPDADIQVDGVQLKDGEARAIQDLSQLRFCGYALNFPSAGNGGTGEQIAVIPPAFPAAPTPSQPPSLTGADPAALPASPRLQVPSSDVILVEIQEQKLAIDVEQTAVYPITIINGGSIVASFEVQVEGVPDEWVKIVPDRVNLNEGSRAGVEVQITPTRSPSSLAGDYSVLIKVGSANYPGQYGGARVELTVNPYYEFAVGNLSPRYKSASWRKRSANTHFPITNQGNAAANYLVMAQDDENGCQFEFQVQEEVGLIKQAEVAVKPGETRVVPIQITPQKRSLVRLRPRQYSYSVTTQSMNESAASRIVSGTFISRPLFGLFSILLTLMLLLVGGFFLLRPRITDFNVLEDVIALGDPAILNWKVSPFTTSLRIEGVSEEISGSQNQIEVVPNNTAATYTLVAGNWLSRLLRMEDVRSKPITVLSIPPTPEVTTFFVDKTRIFEGDDVTIKWSVTDAEQAFLTVDGVRGALKPEEFNSERVVTLRNNSLIVLEAKNTSGSKFRSEFIHAQKPSIVIEEFSLSKTQIIKGEPVTIKWKVSGVGVENVQIAPFEEVYPLEGELTFFPEASMEFVLTIKNRDLEEIRLLPIGVLEPGAEPKPPTVEFFKVAPEEIVGSGTVEFSWSVSGQFDRVEITNLDGVVVAGLPAQGFKALGVEKTTSYVLTAYNGDLSSAAILEVKVNDTKKNVVVVIDKILPSTSIYRGDSVTVYYSVSPATKDNNPVDPIAAGWPEVSGTVVVTDGYDTCIPVALPVHACELTLNTSESNKKISATYSGDDNYVRRTSDPYPIGLDVIGASPVFTSYIYSLTPIVVGQQTKVSFQLAPEDPAATIGISGKVRVVEDDTTLCIANLTEVVGAPLSAKGECLLDFATAGNKFLTLKYEGNDIYDGKTASMPALEVRQAATQTFISANWTSPTVVGEPLVVQFSVGPVSPGTGIPGGQVVVRDKNNPANNCTGTLDAQGKGQCSLTLYEPGTFEILGSYAGDDDYTLSSSVVYLHAVGKASTSTQLVTFTPSTTAVGQEVLVAYQVKAVSPGSGSPTGTVTVDAGYGDTCTGAINAAGEGQCAVLLTRSGVRSLKGTYSGSSAYLTSEALGYSYPVTIANTKTTVVAHSPNPSALNELVAVNFTVETSLASVIKPDGPALVAADTGEVCNAMVTGGVGTCNLLFASEGRRTITVRFLGTGNFASSVSPGVSHNVKKATFTRILTTIPNPSVVDQPVTVQFTVVAVSGGGDQPSGTVTVVADSGETCTGSLSSGTGTCPITFTSSGTKILLATYNGDTDFKPSTSLPFSHSVTKATTNTEITSDLSAATQVGEEVTVAFRVTSNISARPTGSVTVSAVGSSDPRETCTATLSSGTGSCAITLVQAGSARSIQAVYAGTTDRFSASTSPIVNHRVDPAPTTTEILSDLPDPSVVGQQVTFQVRVRANTLAALRPDGSFAVRLANDTDLCSGVLNASSEGSCTYTFNSSGVRSIKAVYLGAADYAGSTSGTGTHNVDNSDTVTAVTISPSPSVLNQQVTVSVSVSPSGSGGGTPSGSVAVTATRSGSTKSCNIASLTAGSGSCNLTLDSVGTWTVNAVYAGDASFNGSSKSATQIVEKVASTTNASVDPAPSVRGQPVTVNVTVAKTGAGSGILSGTVSVTASRTGSSDKTCTVADISSGSGSCTLTPDAVGEWTVSAVYSGSASFEGSSASITHTVNKIPTNTGVSVTPAPSVVGQSVAVSVTVSKSGAGSGTPDGSVLVTATRAGGGTASCQDAISLSSGSGSCNLTLNAAGTWTLSAAYQGSTSFETSSGSAAQTVNAAGTATTVTLSPTSSVTGQEVTVSVSVSPSGSGAGTPAGTVSVTATKSGGGSVSCPSDIVLSGGSGSCKLALPAVGTWTVSATYSGNTNFNTSTGYKTIAVGKAATTLSITGHTPSPSAVDGVVTVTFNLAVASPGGGTPTGLVTVTAKIKVSGTDYEKTCSASGSVGTCGLTLSQLGTWKLSAAYPGDSDFQSVTSAEVNHTVE